MKRDAEAHADEDKNRREVVDLKNQADQLIYQTEKTLKEHGDKVPAETRGNIETAVNKLKEAVKGDDADGDPPGDGQPQRGQPGAGQGLYEEAAKKQAAAGAQAQPARPHPRPGSRGQAQGRRRRHRRRVRSKVTRPRYR